MALCFYLLFYGATSASAQSFYRSQQFDFGTAELLSCSDALRYHTPMYLGIKITPKENWDVQLEDITLATSQPVPIDWFIPFEQPNQNHLLYPISAILTEKPKQPISFKATGNIKACTQGNCQSYPFSLNKILATGFAFILPECEEISQALSYTPIPMYMAKVKGWAIPHDDQHIQITLDFPHRPKTVQLYTQDKQPLPLDINIYEQRAQFLWPKDKEINFFVRTYYAYYEIQLPILPIGTTIPMQRTIVWKIIQTVFLFFLLSAFPIFWSRSTDAPYKIFLKQTKQSLILIFLAGFILSLVVCFKGPLNLGFIPFNKFWTFITMGLGIIFIPAHILLPFLFTFLAPRPYLSFIQTTGEQLLFIILATLVMELTFTIQLIWAKKIHKKLQRKETTSYIWWCCRIPWLFLMLYLIFYL